MSKHQIIFTSCKRGIAGVNDGQQVFSHNEAFKGSGSDHVKSLFSYQVPTLPLGEVMTEERATTMPQSFLYRRLPDGTCAIALKTYLGRDYMGPAGRFGNYLSHAVIVDEDDMKVYPAEIYENGLLRSRMDFDEVNSSDRPAFLPEPELTKGYTVSVENVTSFLGQGERIMAFNKMLAAMLSFKTARKRVVICDTKENIIMWIAALHYALPLEIALNVNFATYEYDPSRSHAQICGVVPDGTAYNTGVANSHFTFDFMNGIVPDIRAEGSFYEFIDMGFSFSYDSVRDFHNFVLNRLTYREADEEYLTAYTLYSLLAGGLNNLSIEAFTNAIKFADAYAHDKDKMEIVNKILSEKGFILSAPDEFSLEIFKALLNKYPTVNASTQDYIKALVTEKVITAFASPSAYKDDYTRFYKALDALCQGKSINIPNELMKDINRKNLLTALERSADQWRWDFMVEMLCDYIIAQRVPVENLSLDHKLGKLMGDILSARLAADTNSGFVLVTRIIARFASDWNYLANLALNLEGVILDARDSETLHKKHWKYVYDMFATQQPGNRQEIYRLFLSLGREDQVFDMFCEFMRRAANIRAAYDLFKEQAEIRNRQYQEEYILRIYGIYYDFLNQRRESGTSGAKRDLLKQIARANMSPDFAPPLIKGVLEEIPLAPLSRENEEMVTILLDYFRGQRAANMPERLMLLASGLLLGKARSAYEMEGAVQSALRVAASNQINLAGLSEADAEKYLGWVAPAMFMSSKSPRDLIANYEVFKHSRVSSGSFISITAKESIRASKERKEYSCIMLFLEFLFNVGSAEDRKEVGRIFCKLSRQNLETLNEAVNEDYKDEMKFLLYWSEVHEVAEKTNPILAGIGNLFRRRK